MVGTWKAGGIAVSINPMNRERELNELLTDSGATVLVCLQTLYRDVAASVVGGTAVSTVFTSSELEFQTGNDPRLFPNQERIRAEGTTDLAGFCEEHRGQKPPAGLLRARRHRVPDLHLGHHRAAQGRDEHARERHVQLATPTASGATSTATT